LISPINSVLPNLSRYFLPQFSHDIGGIYFSGELGSSTAGIVSKEIKNKLQGHLPNNNFFGSFSAIYTFFSSKVENL